MKCYQTMSKLTPEWQQTRILEAVFDQLSDALVLYSPDFTITGVNRAAEKLFGMASEDMIGRHCQEVFRCGVCEPGCGVLVGLNQSPSAPHSTIRLHTDNGMERLVVMRTTQMFDDQGRLEGVVATIKDVTEEAAPQKREVIAESPLMREALNFVRRVAASEATTILLEGENGTGKDLIAKTLHYQSVRQAEPFIAINCAAIPETLLESELFGYEKGAFTDARQQKRGIFELADKGTLFLDEVGEIPLMLQAKLLRVLEEQNFRRLGGLKDIQLDLRVIAATNKNLREAVKEGAFRQDLYFRLNVIQIVLPPMRDRPEDILPLARFFIEHYNRKFRRGIEGRLAGRRRFAAGARLARQRARAAQRHRARHDPGRVHLHHAASLPIAITRPDGQPANAAPRSEFPAKDSRSKTTSACCWPARWKRPAGTRPRRRGCCALRGIRCGIR
jgi:PAS domain S-box-containing protein